MRWEAQRLDLEDPSTLPGMPSIRGLLRTVEVPEFPGLTFHEVAAKSALNHVPAEYRAWLSQRVAPLLAKHGLDRQKGGAARQIAAGVPADGEVGFPAGSLPSDDPPRGGMPGVRPKGRAAGRTGARRRPRRAG
jgi:hypothetical protein